MRYQKKEEGSEKVIPTVALCANYRCIPIIGNMRINYRHRAFIRVVGVARLKLFHVVDCDSLLSFTMNFQR